MFTIFSWAFRKVALAVCKISVVVLQHTTTMNVGQQKALSLLPIVPAMLSIMGSLAIIRLVRLQSKTKSYERILVGLSLSDMVMSVTLVAMNFLSPNGAMVWSIGNSQSCTALGTLYQSSVFSAALYNASLSVYYLLTIRYGMTTEHMALFVEPLLHGISILFPVSTALWGVIVRAYNFIPSLGLCWVECANADCNGAVLRYVFASPIAFAWVTIGVSMCGIWHHVRTTIRRHDHRSTVRTIREQHQAEGHNTRSHQKLSMVATQALLYVGSFSMVTVWPIVLSVIERHRSIQAIMLDSSTAPWLFGMMACCAIFFPMSGFFNCFIFVRPRYLSERNLHKDSESRWQTLHRIICHPQHMGYCNSTNDTPQPSEPNHDSV